MQELRFKSVNLNEVPEKGNVSESRKEYNKEYRKIHGREKEYEKMRWKYKNDLEYKKKVDNATKGWTQNNPDYMKEYNMIRSQLPKEKERKRKWHSEHKDYDYKYKVKIMVKLKLKLFEKYGSKCKRCGEDDLRVLTINHINHDKLTGETRKMYQNILDGKDKEIEILCHNCNIKYEYETQRKNEPITKFLGLDSTKNIYEQEENWKNKAESMLNESNQIKEEVGL